MARINRSPIMHSRTASVYPGDYQVTDAALANYKVSREKFGSTDIQLADGSSFNVKDYQYLLPDGNVGMHLIPISEYGVFTAANGKEVWASQLIDTFLQERMGLKPDDALFALMYYIHPEFNKNSIAGFAQTEKVEMGITHMGSYYGQGLTSNSPPLYHHRRWGVDGEVFNNFGYPCNVMVLSLEGVDQAMLNKNLMLTDKFINNGVKFPVDYKNSMFRMVDINTCLMFYRDWIMEENYLRTDSTWFTYCAAHKTLVTTVALNLPHNKKSFMEVYGEKEGADFYDTFCKNYFALAGEDFTADLETDFEPLWKKEGLTPQQIKPFVIEEYLAYDAARRNGTVDSYTGFKPLKPTQATIWGPQSSADIIYCFVEAYGDFIDAGAIVSCAAVMGFGTALSPRMDISLPEYTKQAMPVLNMLMHAHAKVYAAQKPTAAYKDSAYYTQTYEQLYMAYGGKQENLAASLTNLSKIESFSGNEDALMAFVLQNKLMSEYLAYATLQEVRLNWTTLMAEPSLTLENAYQWFREIANQSFLNAEDYLVKSGKGVQYNTPPAIGHMVEASLHPKNPLVQIQSVCTVMNYTELEAKAVS